MSSRHTLIFMISVASALTWNLAEEYVLFIIYIFAQCALNECIMGGCVCPAACMVQL
jgi:hypothetical protein